MNNRKRSSTVTVIAIVAIFFMQSNLWGAAGNQEPYQTDPNASGTKYSGPLTVYFECILNNSGGCIEDQSNVFFFLRLNKGNDYEIYSHAAGPVENGYEGWVSAFREFVEVKVIGDDCLGGHSCPSFANGRVALKSVKNPYSITGSLDDPSCFIADIVIAVQE